MKKEKLILLIDDELIIQEIGREMIVLMGDQAITSGNGKEAIEIYRQKSDVIDLVILDLNLPDMYGEEILREIKAINPDVRILISSGSGIDDKRVKELLKMGAGFLPKPTNVEEYQKGIIEALKE